MALSPLLRFVPHTLRLDLTRHSRPGLGFDLANHSRANLGITPNRGGWPQPNWSRHSLDLASLLLGIVLRYGIAWEPVNFPRTAMRTDIVTDEMKRHTDGNGDLRTAATKWKIDFET